MDTSETYIKMSDHPKVQEQWKPQDGDWYHRPIGRVFGGINLVKDASFKRHYFNWKNHPEHEVCAKVYKEHTWLPRQDQIQEMMLLESPFCRIVDKLYKFTDWVKINATYVTSSCSMEQLWLAFYIYEKHNLTWDGDKWKDNG